MAFANMSFSLVGQIPGINKPLADSFINEALGKIYDTLIWSFQFKENGWFTPGLQFNSSTFGQSDGTITATRFTDTVVGDATAAAAWLAYFTAGTLPLLTSFQIRSPYYSLYNIVAFDGVNTFTLDRPWMEPDGAGLAYMVYQAYFPAPAAITDFKRFLSIRDTTNASPVNFERWTRADLSVLDPQRTNFNLPAYAVPFEVDERAGSPTAGYMLWELWPHPLSSLPYSFDYLRRGPLLSAPTDTIPGVLTEELVMWRSKEVAALWKEGQKGDDIKRGSGADWQFLSERFDSEYLKELKICSSRDRDLVNSYFNRVYKRAELGTFGEPFATINGQLNVGR